jgi:hypothetical protein
MGRRYDADQDPLAVVVLVVMLAALAVALVALSLTWATL